MAGWNSTRPPRRAFLRQLGMTAGAALAGPGWLSACTGRGSPRPNILLIMADDLGYADTSLYGRPDYTTPVLDGLADDGVRLTQAYASAPNCTPTRVALMTGRYPARTEAGLYEPLVIQPAGLLPDPPTLPRPFKEAGYETALVGKWHLGMAPEFHPLRHGFDEFFGHLGGAIDYVQHVGLTGPDLYDGETPIRVDGYATDLFTDRAVEFISRPRSAPFFLNLQYNAPHWPWQAPGDPPSAVGAGPASILEGGSAATYAAMVKSLDDGVGRVLDAVRRAGIEGDTLVIFTSDNGGERWSDMGPYRGNKGTLWEGGIRVAACARWPGVIPSATVTSQVVATIDWTATLLAAAGAASTAMPELDGRNVLPQLRGAAAEPRDLFWRTFQRTRHRALRSGDLKYLAIEEAEHLFDLQADPGESIDRKGDRPADFERLKAAYSTWASGVLEPIPLGPMVRPG